IASVAAAQMLKVDYLLWMYETRNGDKSLLEDANSTIDKVLANSNYSLLDSYENVFSLKNKNNKEIIFTIHFAQGEAEGGFETVYLIPATKFYSAEANIETHVKIMTSDDQRYNFSPKLIALLKEDPADTRTAVSFGDWTDTSIGMQYTWVNKFSGLWQDKTRYFIADKPIYRYAEALMFKAEIEMLQGDTAESLKYLNKVAKRAYGKDDYYSITSSSELRQTLMNEYLKEFAAEAKSWWCYIRLGYAFTEIESLRGRQNETNILLWPINSACMNENPNIRQTVGY
ncbi:MAG: RagB/SusD family nutrient uptake outer membrane protein, partial [Bacteroidales bacterium]